MDKTKVSSTIEKRQEHISDKMRKSLFEIKRMLDKDLGMEINKVKLLKVLIYRKR
jgi:hypothetical protein